MDVKRNIRKWSALLVAIIMYFVVHEGAHYLYAVSIGAFRRINFIGLGVQVAIFRERMSDTQLGILCLAGPVAALLAGYVLLLMSRSFVRKKSLFFRAAAYYTTFTLLLVDPLYLLVLYQFVGGGDMNGISLIIPETVTRILFGVIAVINLIIIFKYLLPVYRNAYQNSKNRRR